MCFFLSCFFGDGYLMPFTSTSQKTYTQAQFLCTHLSNPCFHCISSVLFTFLLYFLHFRSHPFSSMVKTHHPFINLYQKFIMKYQLNISKDFVSIKYCSMIYQKTSVYNQLSFICI